MIAGRVASVPVPDQDDLNALLGALDAAGDQLSSGQDAVVLEHLRVVAGRSVAAELDRVRELGVWSGELDVVVRVERRDPRSAS